MSWKDFLFSFKGRIDRKALWLFWLAFFIAEGVLRTVDGSDALPQDSNGNLPSKLFAIVSLWPILAVSAKRLHDRGASGFWAIFGFVPLFGQLWALFYLGFGEGEPRPNGYGDAPSAPKELS